MVGPYEEQNAFHEANLRDFYEKLFGSSSLPDNLISEEWKSIGFQGKNPRTDFWGGGFLSLMSLRYMLVNYPGYFNEMRTNNLEDSFFFAISSINVTHMIVVYLRMNKADVPNENKRILANRSQFKTFCKLNCFSKKTFFELQSFTTIVLYYLWMIARKESLSKNSLLLEKFQSVMNKAKVELGQLLNDSRLGDLSDLRIKIDQRLQNLYKIVSQWPGCLNI